MSAEDRASYEDLQMAIQDLRPRGQLVEIE